LYFHVLNLLSFSRYPLYLRAQKIASAFFPEIAYPNLPNLSFGYLVQIPGYCLEIFKHFTNFLQQKKFLSNNL